MLTEQEFKEHLGGDLSLALKETGLPQAIYEKILRSSLPGSEASLNELDSVIAAGDWNRISQIAHDLKGVYANLRVAALSDPAAVMNDLALKETEMKKIVELHAALKSAFAVFKKLLLK